MGIQTPKQVSANLVAPTGRRVIWNVDEGGVVTTQNRTLLAHENHIEVTLSATGSKASVLTMPEVEKAAGQWYFVLLLSDGNNNTLTLSFPDSAYQRVIAGTGWTNDDLTVDDDCILLFSTGVEWIVVIDNTN